MSKEQETGISREGATSVADTATPTYQQLVNLNIVSK